MTSHGVKDSSWTTCVGHSAGMARNTESDATGRRMQSANTLAEAVMDRV
jgi:hypothetical protein